MKLINQITLWTLVIAGTLAASGAMAVDAPKECTATGTGPDYVVSMTVSRSFCRDSIGFDCTVDADCPLSGDTCLTEDDDLTRFAYAITDAHNDNPDHAVLSFSAAPVCAFPSTCSETFGSCTTNDDCDETNNDDVCLIDTECIFAAGETTSDYPDITSGLKSPGEGDSTTITGRYEKSRVVMTSNPKVAVSKSYVDIRGTADCYLGDIVIKTGKKISSCPICAPFEEANLDPGSFATTTKILEIENCRFKRTFDLVGRLVSSEVLMNEPGEEQCNGIVLTKDTDPDSDTFGELVAAYAGEGPVGPMLLNNFSTTVLDAGAPNGMADFGFKQKDKAGGNEDTSGTGTCTTLSDGFGGTTLSCTCQKPLSNGEIRFCR
jgi:hypothetical protein